MSTLQIAIDGPAGAGKSTISKIAANRLGLIYIDTGAMYRAVALFAISRGVDTKNDSDGVTALLDEVKIDIAHGNQGQRIFLNERDVSEEIRTPRVSVGASDVAVIPKVRLKLVEIQRALARKSDVIMDGRDIGTYVLPDAQLKIFLTASPEQRAKRRYDELLEKGEQVSFEDVLRDIKYRDKNDSEREFAPLRAAEDAVVLDTSDNDLETSVNLVVNVIKQRTGI